MDILQAIVLGIVQGITEFLPISSSGHLVIVPYLLGWTFPKDQTFVFDVLVQWGTLFAVIVYFWRDLVDITVGFLRSLWERHPFATHDARLGWYLILATLPAVILGLIFKNAVENAFSDPHATGYFLWITAALLIVAEMAGRRERTLEHVNWVDALWIGFAQVLALFPGVSRSGATIAGGMTRQLDRTASARFSFLMSVPVMLGAGLVALHDMIKLPHLGQFLPPLMIGFLTALIAGYIAIRWLLAYLTKHSLYIFAAYCVLLGLLIIFIG